MSCWRRLRGLAVPAFVLGAMLLAGCWRGPAPSPEESGELVVATRNSPTTYFLDADGNPAGFEHDLTTLFAERQGWRVRFEVADTLEELFDIVASGRAHIAAAGITATEERRARVRFGPNYGQVKEWVVCRQGLSAPAAVKDLVGLRLEVVAGSSHAERLRFHRRRMPELRWTEMELPGPEELMERLDVGLGDCAVVDSDSLDVGRNFHPGLRPAFVLESAQPQAWVLGRGVDLRLSRRVVDFFKKLEAGGDLVRLRERYFGHVTRLAEVDVLGVLDKRATLLNELRPHFHDAQAETGLDWRLLAAIGYQESQWDAHAQSPTGVRGLMMLTRQTADHLGVKDRLDARESILGGARYVVELKAALPETVPEPDRTWLALAAYNIGMGHLNDARALARRLGKNPDQWRDMKNVLPLISRAEYASSLRYGFARGGEARAFAENVRIYYDILRKYEKPHRDLLEFD
ncbi:MAG: family 3 extracellular solute-binding protein [bacterium]|nr:MAG: family 3 extracellular solute-binding protein [bacterium]KAF0148828.1 MAG: family 3 extracellular solute-binding protein [bacterium]KAF0167311.1 MAG: family 3 extracellular solute-binding protein [bacterium]TXT17415.1 MAG: family 3 extracellular solute-binding protein [bacterium]